MSMVAWRDEPDILAALRIAWSRRAPPLRLGVALLVPVVLLASFVGCDNGPIDPDVHPRVIWKVDGTSASVQPAFDSDNVFFGSALHEVIAVDKTTGQVQWRRRTGATSQRTEGNNIVVAGDAVVMGDVDLYAFDRRTGNSRWTFAPPYAQPGFYSSATDGTRIYAGSPEGLVFAIDAATGVMRWQAEVPGDTAITAAFSPTYSEGVVFVGVKTFGSPVATGGLAAFRAATGEMLWFRSFAPELSGQGSGSLGGAVFAGSLVIAASDDGRIYGIDRGNGEVRWIAPRVHPVPPYNDTRYLAVSGDRVIATSNHVIVVGLDAATGVEVWKRSFSNMGSLYPPAVDNQALYVTGGGPLVSLRVADGTTRWQLQLTPRGDSWVTPVVDGDRLYVPELENGFYALRAN
ncbi:MAG: PQQ-binding-like beta-propeller repeat protein [Gemmatimonadaceae bacterium]